MAKLTHLDDTGRAHMVDVGSKPETHRIATARGHIKMTPETLDIVEKGNAKKGDVVAIARLAGIMGAKRTAELIPLCHPLPLDAVSVDITADPALPGLRVEATAMTTGKTGVEMEALTAVSTACLTIYDMLKAVDRGMEIGGIAVTMKDGGASGRYEAE